jgi:hypothetical protein
MACLHASGLLAEIDGSNDANYHLSDGLGSTRGLAVEQRWQGHG